jgi:hypothetical protein
MEDKYSAAQVQKNMGGNDQEEGNPKSALVGEEQVGRDKDVEGEELEGVGNVDAEEELEGEHVERVDLGEVGKEGEEEGAVEEGEAVDEDGEHEHWEYGTAKGGADVDDNGEHEDWEYEESANGDWEGAHSEDRGGGVQRNQAGLEEQASESLPLCYVLSLLIGTRKTLQEEEAGIPPKVLPKKALHVHFTLSVIAACLADPTLRTSNVLTQT